MKLLRKIKKWLVLKFKRKICIKCKYSISKHNLKSLMFCQHNDKCQFVGKINSCEFWEAI